ncbi:MAG: [protein-PII] uridylyltransferase family protein, partial [Bdellovibrionales bacterium]
MATRSFLLDSQIEEGIQRLLGDGVNPFPDNARVLRQSFSLWLEERLLARLQSFGDFGALKPVLLGSWARHELSPKSDIDLLFAGEESQVKEFIAKAFRDGLKLRARTPKDPADWSQGVEPFDVLALKVAKGYNDDAENLLIPQRNLAIATRKNILAAIKNEREERRKRQDSISNYLEPNLKFGAGGLRDIEQALAVKDLFPEKFHGTEPYPFAVLETIKDEFLYLRSLLHMIGSGDILSAHDQIEIAKRLNMESPQILMKFVQSELERASFYADWAVANAMSAKKAQQAARVELTSVQDA